jgi:hypothetical protein
MSHSYKECVRLFQVPTCIYWGTRWCNWLRHYATSWKVAASIPNGVTGIFHWHNASGHTVAQGSTQLLTEMSTRNISWEIKAPSAYGWQPYHLHVAIVMKSGSLNLLEPLGPVQAYTGIALPLPACICHTWDCLAAPFEIVFLLNDSVQLAALSLFLAGFCSDSAVLQLFWQMSPPPPQERP